MSEVVGYIMRIQNYTTLYADGSNQTFTRLLPQYNPDPSLLTGLNVVLGAAVFLVFIAVLIFKLGCGKP